MRSLVLFCWLGAIGSTTALLPRTFKTVATSSTLLNATPVMSSTKMKVPIFDEVCETTGVTLTRFMNEVAMLNPELRELASLFGAIDTACKAISNQVKRSQLPSSETLGYQGAVNVQGEDQKVQNKRKRKMLWVAADRFILTSYSQLFCDRNWMSLQINCSNGRCDSLVDWGC